MAAMTFPLDRLAPPSRRVRLGHALASARSGIARVALFRRVPELLDAMGEDADAILASIGLARADFEDAENQMPYFQLEQLLVECGRRTGCDHFGLLLCEQSRLDDLGLPGRVARCANTVGEGLDALVRAYNLHRGGGIVNLIDTGELARFVYAIAMPGTRDTRHYQMGAITIMFNVLEDLCGPEWQANEVRFALRSPASVRPFHRLFRAPVHFDADESVIVFDSAWLSRALAAVDDSFRRSVAAELHWMRERAFEDFPGLVRDLIRKQLSSGPCSIETVAAMLSMHSRSLERRLARAGEDYSSLQQSVKHEIAVQLLRETAMSVQEIADFLRFSSAANFATAFRRWTEQSPTQFRASES
jgi:AraC-like DNA-binding protein